jgi:hypothetical protein
LRFRPSLAEVILKAVKVQKIFPKGNSKSVATSSTAMGHWQVQISLRNFCMIFTVQKRGHDTPMKKHATISVSEDPLRVASIVEKPMKA